MAFPGSSAARRGRESRRGASRGFLPRVARLLCGCACLAAAGSAWAAGTLAQPNGAAGVDIGVFSTNGLLDAVIARIDGGLWYSTGGAFSNIGAANQRVRLEVISSTDVSGLAGTEIYIGYGTSDAEMLQAQRYRGVYIVN